MKRLTTPLLALTLVCAAPFALAQDPTDPKEFWVEMKGLICHVTSGVQRAVLVHGSAIGMRHVATLYVPNTVKVSALRDATRQLVMCEKVDLGTCSVVIEGFSMRIARAKDTKAVAVDLKTDPSFDVVVPHLGQLSAGSKPLPSLGDDLPSGAAAGFFEMTTGTLYATAFDMCGGKYLDHDGDPINDKCLPFPSWVTVQGALDEPAVLQIRSAYTLNRWTTIPMNNSGALFVWVENRPTNHNEDQAHITLYEHLFWDADIPTVEMCSLPGKSCSTSSAAAHPSTEGTSTSAAHAFSGSKAGIVFAVPGCDNTQFP